MCIRDSVCACMRLYALYLHLRQGSTTGLPHRTEAALLRVARTSSGQKLKLLIQGVVVDLAVACFWQPDNQKQQKGVPNHLVHCPSTSGPKEDGTHLARFTQWINFLEQKLEEEDHRVIAPWPSSHGSVTTESSHRAIESSYVSTYVRK